MLMMRWSLPVMAHSVVAMALFTGSVYAQVGRTFVSTSGSDANTASLCSLTNPCRSFGSAVTVTNAGGEIIALTSGGYGPFTINKSVSVIAPDGVYAGVTVSSGDGVTINAAGATVVLRGLQINSQGTMGSGIVVTNVGSVYVESCVIHGFDSGSAILHTSSGRLSVKDTVARNNSYGIWIQAPVSTTVSAWIDNTHVEKNTNTNFGIFLEARVRATITRSSASGNGIGILAADDSRAAITDSTMAGNASYGVAAQNANTSLTVRNSTASGNGNAGFYASTAAEMNVEECAVTGSLIGVSVSGSAVVRVSNSVVSNNTTGFSNNASVFESRGNNTLRGNTTATSGTITIITGN